MISGAIQNSTILACDEGGKILKVAHDGLGIAGDLKPGQALGFLVDQGSFAKVLSFLVDLKERGAAHGWEVSAWIAGQFITLSFSGVAVNDTLVVFISRAGIEGQEGPGLTMVQDRLDSAVYDEISRLNNDLINLQRELAKKNVQLERSNKALRHAVEEKTVLLKEVQHRVKNNLQMVATLLELQARNSPNPEAVEVLEESRRRIRSMAMLHEALYRSDSLAHIKFNTYVEELCQHLRSTVPLRPAPVTVENLVPPVKLPLKESVSCGLIINELVTNALKHAFPHDRPGKVSVSLKPGPEQLVLTVSDNGVGLLPGMDVSSARTLGLRLVSGLASQLDGHLTVTQLEDGGAVFQVTFPTPEGILAEED